MRGCEEAKYLLSRDFVYISHEVRWRAEVLLAEQQSLRGRVQIQEPLLN